MAPLHHARASFQPLGWDDDEEPTKQSVRPHSHVPAKAARPLPPRRQQRSGSRVKDTIVDMDCAPHTERDAPASSGAPLSTPCGAPVTESSPRYGEDESPTAAFKRVAIDAAPDSFPFIPVEDAAPLSSPPVGPESEVRPTISRPGSVPIPLIDDDFDRRETNKRGKKITPLPSSKRDTERPSSPIALVSNVSLPATPQRRAPEPPPPPPLVSEPRPEAPAESAASVAVRTPELTRSAHMPLVHPSVELHCLRAEVQILRRRLIIATTIAVIALLGLGVLAALLWIDRGPIAAPAQRAQGASLAGLPELPRGKMVVALPPVPEAAIEAAAAAEESAAPPEGKVEVVITLVTPTASVFLTRFGEMPQAVTGPWPVTLQLDPGKYTLTAARFRKATIMRMLDLSLDRPRREVTLRVP